MDQVPFAITWPVSKQNNVINKAKFYALTFPTSHSFKVIPLYIIIIAEYFLQSDDNPQQSIAFFTDFGCRRNAMGSCFATLTANAALGTLQNTDVRCSCKFVFTLSALDLATIRIFLSIERLFI